MTDDSYDVVIVGGGVAGRSAGIFTARHDFDTAILGTGGSLLRRNAHLENFPGFPAGVNARLLLDMMADQAERAGVAFREAEAIRVSQAAGDRDNGEDSGFVVETAEGDRLSATYVIAATKNAVDYLEGLDGVGILDRGKKYVDTDERGRTGVDGLYAAGRLAEKPHQTIVAAGHGAEVAVTLLEEADEPFYHDWVAPDKYFTGRGREVPPGCEEIGEEERKEREQEAREVMQEYFSETESEPPEQHPSVASEDD